jgi:hypothetical protein
MNEITRLELITPNAAHPSPELRVLIGAGHVQLRQGEECIAILGFDGQSQGATRDFRPVLPLMFKW